MRYTLFCTAAIFAALSGMGAVTASELTQCNSGDLAMSQCDVAPKKTHSEQMNELRLKEKKTNKTD